ncbi:ATP-3 protein [Aphelenchoides avenae]|nr:ATP-3 protein [Aphelenchus avenae]
MAARLVLKRSFSVSSIVGQAGQGVIRPPVQVYGVEGKYAAALYSSAVKSKKLDTVDKDLKSVHDLYSSHKQFKGFVDDPTLNRYKKKEAVMAVLSKIGVSTEAQNFFGMLAENGRMNKLKNVLNSFDEIMRAHRGQLDVEVTSAEELSAKHKSALQDALGSFAKQGQKLNVNFAVKPSLVGGLVVTIGDKYVDLSVASRIKKLSSAIEGAI